MLIYNAVCWFTTQNSDWIRGVLNDYVLCWSNKQHVDCLRCVDWLHGLLMTLPCVDWLCKYALWWMTIDYELHWLSVHCFDLLCIVLKDHCCFHWLCTVCIDFAMYWLTTLLRLLLWSWWLNNKKKFNSEALLSNSKPGFRFSNIVYRKSKNWKIGILVF